MHMYSHVDIISAKKERFWLYPIYVLNRVIVWHGVNFKNINSKPL